MPQPDGPSRKKSSPELICRSMASTASVLSYLFVKPVNEIAVIGQDNNRVIKRRGIDERAIFYRGQVPVQCTMIAMMDPQSELDRLRKYKTRRVRETSINETVQSLRKGLRKGNKTSSSLIEAWDAAVPSHIANQATMVSMRNGVLEVLTDGSSVAYQLNRLVRSGLLRELQKATKGTLRKIRVRSV